MSLAMLFLLSICRLQILHGMAVRHQRLEGVPEALQTLVELLHLHPGHLMPLETYFTDYLVKSG